MSANLGRRLYAHLWESANPLLGRIGANRPSAPDVASRKVFDSIFANHRRLSTLSGKPTHFTRRLASGGFLILGASPTSAATESSAACIIPSKKITVPCIWKRALHTPDDSKREQSHSDKTPSSSKEERLPQNEDSADKIPSHSSRSSKSSQELPHSTYSNRHLMDRLPHMPHLHRPTKEELLAAATGFWSRLKVRFKWFSIRSVRPFNLDEITALFSWVLLGHVVWVVLGTTTFFSLLILAINTVFAQGMCVPI